MDKEVFRNPMISRKLDEAQVPLWFWNDKLDDDELIRQMNLMTEKGITCSAPHARSGFEGGYLDQEWMGHIKTVIDYKNVHGESMWLYDEFNWPAGIANGEVTKNEAFREKYLKIVRHDVPAGKRFRSQKRILRPNTAGEDHQDKTADGKQREKIDNIYCYDAETMEHLDNELFQPVDTSGQLNNISGADFELLRDRDTIVYVAEICMNRYEDGGFYQPDYMNPQATERFLEITYQPYYENFPQAFGSVITASFDDETRFAHALPWTDHFPVLFEARYGYRIEEHLAELILPGEEAGRIRCDYYNLVADLFRECFHQKNADWCRSHGISYTPHFLGEECMAGHAKFSGDFMRQERAATDPGVDHLGRGIGSLNIRFASSAGEVYGKKKLMCEAFAAAGWDMTFEQYLRQVSWLYSQGVLKLVNHGFFYSIRDFRANDWPPSQFFQWKGWERMEEGNAMCRRLYGVMSESIRNTDLLIYHPIESFWLHYIPDQEFTHGYHMGPIVEDARAAEIDHKEQVLLNRLQENNRDFTVFPSDATDLFTAENGTLKNILTGQIYHTFLLPMCEVLPLETAKLLKDFSGQGGRLIIMESIPKYSMKKAEDKALQMIMSEILAAPRTIVIGKPETVNSENRNFGKACHGRKNAEEENACTKNAGTENICKKNAGKENTDITEVLAWLDEHLPQSLRITKGPGICRKTQESYPDWVIDPYIHTGEDITGISWTRFDGDRTYYYLINYDGQSRKLTAEVSSETVPEIWNPLTGEIKNAEVLSQKDGMYTLDLELPPYYGIFLTVNH